MSLWAGCLRLDYSLHLFRIRYYLHALCFTLRLLFLWSCIFLRCHNNRWSFFLFLLRDNLVASIPTTPILLHYFYILSWVKYFYLDFCLRSFSMNIFWNYSSAICNLLLCNKFILLSHYVHVWEWVQNPQGTQSILFLLLFLFFQLEKGVVFQISCWNAAARLK